ncbi:MAG TPA: hypothetical protein VNP04_32495, partial [Alphaproteobacteria bacterium]|nr:hypothetical protein [Alphaproteobacteria bacterium]
PDVGPVLGRLDSLLPGDQGWTELAGAALDDAALSAEQRAALAAALAQGACVWRFTFVPSPALAERGINVNTVRQRLQEVGELIQATPQVLPEGRIAFTFLVQAIHGDPIRL